MTQKFIVLKSTPWNVKGSFPSPMFWDLETKLQFLIIYNFIYSASVLAQAFLFAELQCAYFILLILHSINI